MTIACLIALFSIPILGGPPTGANPVPHRTLQSVRTPHAPQIDGDLNDAVWKLAKPTRGFTISYPDPGKPAAFETVVRVLHDDEALYVAAHLKDPEPDKIVARITRRDRWIESDQFGVDIDSRHDHRTAFWFRVNAAGVLRDGTWFDENQPGEDWDGVWEGTSRIVADGWCAEIRIPLKLLRFSGGDEVTFGIQFVRWTSRLYESSNWQFVPPDSGLVVSKWGELTGLDLKEPPASFEVVPYIAARPGMPTSGTTWEPIRRFDAGVDARMGIGRNFNLTLTANPDFGQVEVDQVVLNLSTIETYYPEKRPFFLEDMSLFQTPSMQGGGYGSAQQFYTRRIGRSPRYPETSDDEDVIRSARLPRIYGAAKFAGQTSSRLSMGIVQAVTSREDALLRGVAGPEFSRLAEPLTSFTVLRLKQDFWDHSSVGFLGTSAATPGDGSALTGGADLQMELFGGDYKLGVLSFVSYLTEERYAWQDDFVRSAIEEEGPLGYGGQITFAKTGGEHILGSVNGFWYSANLALNDLGYLERADRAFVSAQIRHRRLKFEGVLAQYSIALNGWIDRSTSGANLGDGLNLDGYVDFKNGWGGGLNVFSGFPVCDDRETRSEGRVPLCGQDHRWRFNAWVWSDSRQPVFGWVDFYTYTTEHGQGYRARVNLSANFHPQLQLELIPGYQHTTGSVRWIDTEETAGDDRYLFADQHVEYWDVTFRGTFTFTTTLSLQAYAQVFLVSVDHGTKYARAISEDSSIRVADLARVNDVEDEYDYTATTLNLSALLRWEYLPGSVAYLVYTSAFGDSLEVPEFRFGSLMGDLFSGEAQHVLLLKLSYLWG